MGCLSGLVIDCPPDVWRRTGWCFAALLLCCGLLLSSGCGCGKEHEAPPPSLPEVYTNRANDQAWFDTVTNRFQESQALANVLVGISKQMSQHVDRVRGTLPEGAGEAALQAALAADAQWKDLEARAAAQREKMRKDWEANGAMVRDRMIADQQKQKDVVAGKAKSLDKPWYPQEKKE